MKLLLNNPQRGEEACGTSGMKAALNGNPNLSVLDGWYDEAYETSGGWAIGDREPYSEDQDEMHTAALLSLFENSIQPITVVVMLDTSGSMTMNLDLLKQAATQFVIRLLPTDKARVGSFSDKIRVAPRGFTSDRDELMRILRDDIQYGNPTALWDATNVGMEALKDIEGRRVVLVFTDGADNWSRLDEGDILARARNEEFLIYAIGLRSRLRGQGVTRPDAGLRKVAEETGGGYFELTRTDELNSTFTRVAAELHSQYVLGFTPLAVDGKVHKLEVRINRPGLVARARKSYVAK